jgi:DNA processing protein
VGPHAADDHALPLAERLAWLALSWGAELGPAAFARVLKAFGSAAAALQAEPAELVHGEARLKPEQAAAVPFLREGLEGFAEELRDLALHGVRAHFSPDPGYPRPLRELPHPPPVVCLAGELAPLDDLAVAVVGTRSPTLAGADLAGNLACSLSGQDFTVISGLARGIDTAAHLGALTGDGRTIAVLGSGILNVQPEENVALAARIRGHGAVISELPPQAPPTVPNLMARNRLTSILARAVIVVECRLTGGSLATVENALHQGREVYAVTWADGREEHAGNRRLLADGARPLQGPQDIRDLCLHLRGFRHHTPPPPREQAQGQMRLFS